MAASFARSYQEARKAFTAAASANSDVKIYRYAHPLSNQSIGGVQGPFEITVAVHGSEDASKTIVTTSATHGVEGYAGSALQTRWLQAAGEIGRRAGGDVRIVHVHMLNPVGAALCLRSDEHGVDLNRNFLPDFSKPPPTPVAYTKLASAINPRDANPFRNTWALTRIWVFLAYTMAREGSKKVQDMGGGQYSHPQGLAYGGDGPSWTNTTWKRIAAEHCGRARNIMHLDIHTMLGRKGEVEIIHANPDQEGMRQIWSGENVHSSATHADTSLSAPLSGDIIEAWDQIDLPRKPKVTAATMEIGTTSFMWRPLKQMGGLIVGFMITRDRHRYWFGYEDKHPKAMRSRQRLLDFACPPDEEWEKKVVANGNRVFYRALDHLAAA